jgi:hypothetical protein
MVSRGYIRELVEVSQEKLFEMIETETHIIRAGASIDCDKRANGYEGELYSGVMFYARTQNMMKAEDKLLAAGWKNGNCKHNLQEFSNAKEEPGFVYIIQGKKYSD